MNELKFYQFGKYLINMQLVAYMHEIVDGNAKYMRVHFSVPYGTTSARMAWLDIPMADYLDTRQRIDAAQKEARREYEERFAKPVNIKGMWDD